MNKAASTQGQKSSTDDRRHNLKQSKLSLALQTKSEPFVFDDQVTDGSIDYLAQNFKTPFDYSEDE